MTSVEVARCTVVLFVVVAVQNTLLDNLRVAGAHPDAMILLPMAAGYAAGPERGAAFGFVAGLLADLFLPTTFGLSALVGCLLGYGTGLTTRGLVRSSWWLPVIVAAGATAVGLCGYAILASVLGASGTVSIDLIPALAVAVPGSMILATPVVRMVAWALPPAATGRGASVGSGTR